MPISRLRIPWRRAASAGLALATLAGCAPAPDPADLVVTHGRVYTFTWGDPGPEGLPAADAPYDEHGWRPDAEAVAVADGEIVFVGTSADAVRWIGPDTRVLDAGGATVLPGLVDSHTHVAGLGARETGVDLVGVDTEEEAVARTAAVAGTTPAGTWIVGRGWDEGAWADRYPTAELLSRAVPDHPVLLDSLHGFAVWGNREALELAGIGRDTVAPEGGEILRGPGGEPTGVLLNRAGALLRDAVPEPTPERFAEQVAAGLRRMARDGFVAVHEAGAARRHMVALEALAAAGELPIRVYAMLSARDPALCRKWLDRGPLTGLEAGARGRLAARSVKAYYDGALGSRGARLLDDYADRPGHRGVAGGAYGFDRGLVAAMMEGGFQVGIHAIGDAGNRETLDFLASVIARAPGARRLRHRIEHAQVLHPADVPRFAELGVIASMEPPHAVEDMAWAEDRLGPERIRGAYAWRTLRRAGAEITFNSDLTGSDHSIFYGLHAAVTRRDRNRRPPGGWYPEERLTPEEAVRAYTVWAARAAHWEEATGTVAPGRWGDLTLLDLDPLALGETDPGALLEGSVVATVVAGEVVFEARSGDGASSP